MGNCLKLNKIVEQVETHGYSCAEAEEKIHTRSPTSCKSSDLARPIENWNKKTVKFKLGEEVIVDKANNFNVKRDNVVSFRIVVSKQELNQILISSKKNYKYSSVEKFLEAMNFSSRRISDVKIGRNEEDIGRDWKPELETIPEDH